MADPTKNFAYSTVATAPSPAASGTSLVLAAGQGARFPDPAASGAFNLVIWPINDIPLPTNAEIVRCTARSTDTLTITRTQETTAARSVIVGDQVMLSPTAIVFNDFAILTGRPGGQVLRGGGAASENLTLQSTGHATKGKLLFGTSAYDEVNNRLGIGNAAPNHQIEITGVANVRAINILGTLSTNTYRMVIQGQTTYTADGLQIFNLSSTIITTTATAEPQGMAITPTFQPSASLNNAYGLQAIATANPDSGVTITEIRSGYFRVDTAGADGSVTSAYAIQIGAPFFASTLKPGAIVGISVSNQGATGITTAIGIKVDKPTAATNLYYFAFDVADATAAGTYHGRLPVRYNGLLKYIHIFNA